MSRNDDHWEKWEEIEDEWAGFKKTKRIPLSERAGRAADKYVKTKEESWLEEYEREQVG